MGDEELVIINDDGDKTIIWHQSISPADQEAVETLLRRDESFVPTFSEDPYDTALYIQQEGFSGTKTLLLLDTNVFTRVVELSKGNLATPEHLVPAAVMSFASCARLLTLPAPGLYEEAITRGDRNSNLDLAYFQAGDNLDPQEWADIALGRTPKLKTELSPAIRTDYDFALPLRSFSFAYPLVLKLAQLELQGGTRHHRFQEFIDWQFEHWLFSASANLLAIRLFSASPPRKALKNLRSPQPTARKNGIRNAATDLAFANCYYRFYKDMNARNELTVFCTRDTLLRNIVQDLRSAFNGEDVLDQRIADELGHDVLAYYQQLNLRLKSRARKYSPDPLYSEQITKQLETELGLSGF